MTRTVIINTKSSNTTEQTLAQKIAKGRKYQIVVILVIAALFGIRDVMAAHAQQNYLALAAIYGGALSIVVSMTLSLAVLKATSVAKNDPKTAMGLLYVSAVIRFILILALFAIGIGWLGLNPIPLVIAAVATWLTGIVASR